MKYLFPFLFLVCTACAEFSAVPELEPNKFENEIPNPITVDSIQVTLLNPTYCSTYVYFHLDKNAFENAWDEIDYILFTIAQGGQNGRIINYELPPANQGVVEPKVTYTNTPYTVSYSVVLKNGRTSPVVFEPTFTTPKF